MAINTKDYSPTRHPGISIHKNKTDYLLNINIDGKRYRRVFKANPIHPLADRLKTAYAARELLHEEILHKNSITADADATINDYWVNIKKLSTWDKRTIKVYDYFYMKHMVKISKLKVRSVKPVHLTGLNASMSELKTSTKSKAYEILRKIFDQAIEDEVISSSPIKRSHIPKRSSAEEKKVIIGAEDKYRRVYEAINSLFKDNPHHRAAFLFGFHGRRLQEVLKLEWTDIDFETMTYIIRSEHSKVKTDMSFTLPADVAAALYEFRTTKGGVFNVSRLDRHYKHIRSYTGIPEYSFHWMRNLSVSALAAMGADITHLSAMLGHTDGSTIKKYLSLQRETSTKKMEDLSKKLLSK